MLGDIDDLEVKPSTYRGMTPRIFEFLFARIRAVIIIVFTFLFGIRARVCYSCLFYTSN